VHIKILCDILDGVRGKEIFSFSFLGGRCGREREREREGQLWEPNKTQAIDHGFEKTEI
jgi:hypothetical protein